MDYKKTNAPSNTITRNMVELCEDTGNVPLLSLVNVPTRLLLR